MRNAPTKYAKPQKTNTRSTFWEPFQPPPRYTSHQTHVRSPPINEHTFPHQTDNRTHVRLAGSAEACATYRTHVRSVMGRTHVRLHGYASECINMQTELLAQCNYCDPQQLRAQPFPPPTPHPEGSIGPHPPKPM